jgi:PAS domain S-box-containing protein
MPPGEEGSQKRSLPAHVASAGGIGQGQDLGSIPSVGIYRADLDGRRTFVDQRWSELAGCAAGAALGYGWLEAIHPEDRGRVWREWQRAREGVPFRIEYRFLHADGSIVWVLGEIAEERSQAGELLGYVGVVMDISELRRMREELQAARAGLECWARERSVELEQLRWIMESCDEAIIISDFNGAIIHWNPAAERIFGYTREEMLGQSTLLLAPPEARAAASGLKKQVRNGEPVEQVEMVRISRSGRPVEVALSAFPLRDTTGRIVGAAAMVRDITGKRARMPLVDVSEIGPVSLPVHEDAGVLTPREKEVLKLLAIGRSNKEVATTLGISVKTAETHRARISRKLRFASVVDLVHYAIRHHYIAP